MIDECTNKKPFLKKECLCQVRFEKWCSELLQPASNMNKMNSLGK